MKARLYLASNSPRRKQLLENIGIYPEVLGPKAAEMQLPESIKTESELELISLSALQKTETSQAENQISDGIFIGADTVVISPENKILGKPKNEANAKAMLANLSNRTHAVVTGFALSLFEKNKLIKTQKKIVQTKVKFKQLSADEINWYLSSGEAFDKAGAYGIQGKASVFVEEIQGPYDNVVGLPVLATLQQLEKLTESSWLDWCAHEPS